MRILLAMDAQQLPLGNPQVVGYGGIQAVVWYLASALVQRGHQVVLLAPVGSTVPAGVYFLPHLPGSRGSRYREWIAWAEVVHTHDWGRLAREWAPHSPWTPWVMTWHGPAEGLPPHVPPNVTVTGVSPWHTRYIHQIRPRLRIAPFQNGIDLRDYPLYTGPRSEAALFLASRLPYKGLHGAMQAAIRSGRPLWIAGPTASAFQGDARYQRQLRRLWSRIPQGSRDGGEARGRTKVWLLQHARMTVVPHAGVDEAFGLWAVESLACGTPAIGWQRGASPETIGPAGATVNSWEQLTAVFRHPPAVPPALCRSQASRWATDIMAQQAEGAYQSARARHASLLY